MLQSDYEQVYHGLTFEGSLRQRFVLWRSKVELNEHFERAGFSADLGGGGSKVVSVVSVN